METVEQNENEAKEQEITRIKETVREIINSRKDKLDTTVGKPLTDTEIKQTLDEVLLIDWENPKGPYITHKRYALYEGNSHEVTTNKFLTKNPVLEGRNKGKIIVVKKSSSVPVIEGYENTESEYYIVESVPPSETKV